MIKIIVTLNNDIFFTSYILIYDIVSFNPEKSIFQITDL